LGEGEARDSNTDEKEDAKREMVEWTPLLVVHVAALFIFAGLAEIGGGWMVWQAVREGKPWW